MGFVASKDTVDLGVVDFWSPCFTFFDGQLLPLIAQIQQLQNIIEDRMQREFRL